MIDLKNKKGVSPVIGVILMVAVTVILAAVIASFIFGLGTKVKSAPQVQLYLEDASDKADGKGDELFTVTHYGGDDLNLEEIKLQVVGKNKTGNDITCTLIWDKDDKKFSGDKLETNNNNDIRDGILSVGESFTVKEQSNKDVFNNTTLTLRVIHIPTGTIIFEGSVRVQ